MATATVFPGICGFQTTIVATMEDDSCAVKIESQCPGVRRLAEHLTTVDPFMEMRAASSDVLRLAAAHCPHASCPIPGAIIKAVEIEAGLALPKDVTIQLSRD